MERLIVGNTTPDERTQQTTIRLQTATFISVSSKEEANELSAYDSRELFLFVAACG